jgi:penicillin-insensitive murein endopeptidase
MMMFRTIQIFTFLLLFAFLTAPAQNTPDDDDGKVSVSVGTVGKGKLINGKRIPFKGKNYEYFNAFSYNVLNRAYVNSEVKKVVLQTYKECETFCPDMKFILMECSNKNGGKMKPHHTHQNGLSIDFGTPLLKKGKQCFPQNATNLYGYDMDFDKDGQKDNDKEVKIDFETMAKHLYILYQESTKNGLKIEKVIFKTALHEKLFATEYGKKIKGKMYFAQKLTPLLNRIHDDQYHVDFALAK